MDFNFDEWVAHARDNPAEFDRRRREEIEKIISAAPQSRQPQLRYLQFCIDMERWRSSSPMQACSRINAMMWRKVADLQSALHDFQTIMDKSLTAGREPRPAAPARRT